MYLARWVCICLCVAFSLAYLGRIKGADSSVFQSTVSLGVTHLSSMVLLGEKRLLMWSLKSLFWGCFYLKFSLVLMGQESIMCNELCPGCKSRTCHQYREGSGCCIINQEMVDVELKRGKFKCRSVESRVTDLANNRNFYLKSSSVRSVRLRLEYIYFILCGDFL